MRNVSTMTLACLTMGISACASMAETSEALGDAVYGDSASGKEAMVRAANAYPLGSAQNPVRVFQGVGERAYLARLRCSDDSNPHVTRVGSGGQGPFRTMMTVYSVDCRAALPGQVLVYMDNHFERHEENRPVPGFTITPRAQ